MSYNTQIDDLEIAMGEGFGVFGNAVSKRSRHEEGQFLDSPLHQSAAERTPRRSCDRRLEDLEVAMGHGFSIFGGRTQF